MAERVLVPTQIGLGDRYYTYLELLAIYLTAFQAEPQ